MHSQDPNPPVPLPSRQIHLDFHTSPDIADVGREFDGEAFAEAVEAARVESITIFAKCHHGMCYYPTKCGVQHPALKGRDLMGEQIEALHRRGIRCPLYLTVGWEEVLAHTHVDWRQMTRDGHSVRAEPTMGDNELIAGGWYWMNWLHPDYQAHMEEQVVELLDHYTVDGLFFDIVVFDPSAGWSPEAVKFRKSHGLDKPSQTDFDRFLGLAQRSFTERFSKLIRDRKPEASIFYNSAAILTTDGDCGIRNRASAQSHYELESLPGGHWGYYHFPRIGRFVPQLGLPWIGQTGRFQKSWGDFGGIKPDAALEYECFRSQALGGGVEVGDQLLPHGKFDKGALDLIGRVYTQVEAAESFYADSEPFFDLGIIVAGSPGCDWQRIHRSESGAVQLAQAARRNPVLLDDQSPLSNLQAIVLPDEVVLTDALVEKLEAYHAEGGNLILSHRSGFDDAGKWRLGFLPFRPAGLSGQKPTYWRKVANFSSHGPQDDRVLYSEGMNIEFTGSAEVLVERVLPLFPRTDARFCGHFQAPPREDADNSPALIGGRGFLYFADPIFREYRQSCQMHVRDTWRAALERLLGPPLLDTRLPASIETYPARRGNDLLLTLLRYLPVRKAMEIDIIDEALPFNGEQLRFSRPPGSLLCYPDGKALSPDTEGAFPLAGRGRLLLKAPGFFGP